MAKIKKNVTKNEMMYRIQRKIMYCIRRAAECMKDYYSEIEAGKNGAIHFELARDYKDTAETLSILFLTHDELNHVLPQILQAIESEIDSRV